MLVASAKPLFLRTTAKTASPSPGSTSCFITGGSDCAVVLSDDVLAMTPPSEV
jgi:hypothetical protein